MKTRRKLAAFALSFRKCFLAFISSFWDLLCRYLRNCMWHVEKRRELEERQLTENKCLKDLVKLSDGSQKGNWTREVFFFSKGN